MTIDGPIVGIRLWLVDRQTLSLRSSAAIYKWKPGPQEAVCNAFMPTWYRSFDQVDHPPHLPVPQEGCPCGFHAFYGLDQLYDFFGSTAPASSREVGLVGLIRGWGNVRLHHAGWRSLYAEPAALFKGFDSRNEEAIPSLADRYEIPILQRSSYPHIMGEFGCIVPTDMRPHAKPRENSETP